MNYGSRELEPGITLCHYMLSELNDIDFQTVPYDTYSCFVPQIVWKRGTILQANDFLNRQAERRWGPA